MTEARWLARLRRIRLFVLFVLFVCTGPFVTPDASSAESLQERPHWSVEIKGGYFYPAADNWTTYYGNDRTWQIAGAVAYKFTRRFEAGVEVGWSKDQGVGYAPLNGITTGKVDYEIVPANAFLLYRGIFKEEQWLVPYAGGGYTKLYYRQNIEGQETTKGSVNGYHGRAGLQFLLDRIDVRAADNMYLGYGISHTYFFVEVEYIHAMADTMNGGSVNLGGTSYLGGFLFEF